jgi:hypothetical protein
MVVMDSGLDAHASPRNDGGERAIVIARSNATKQSGLSLRMRLVSCEPVIREFVGWAKAQRAVPTVHPLRGRMVGTLSLCPPYEFFEASEHTCHT